MTSGIWKLYWCCICVPTVRHLTWLIIHFLSISWSHWELQELKIINRTQRVSINGSISNQNVIMSGVPQGSILGLLLFLLFINDMPEYVSKFYSWYLCWWYLIMSVIKILMILKMFEWRPSICKLDDKLMKANASKTKVMILGTPAKTSN